MYKVSAQKIFDGKGNVFENKVIVLDKNEKIVALEDSSNADGDIQHINGWVCPGFVNTHCHLELSHMKDKVDTGTGLIPFIKKVVTYRDLEAEIIQSAIKAADEEMFQGGIVAVGDISNKTDTCGIKIKSPIRYYTFVEMFDFMQPQLARATFDQYMSVYNSFDNLPKNCKSVVPHAPYSVSDNLYHLINQTNNQLKTISIHNEETKDEISLFEDKKGGFPEFFGGFGFPLDHFIPIGKSSIFYALQKLDPIHRTLFVHNTLTTEEGILSAHQWSDQVYWATCANANLYIENRLPDYKGFLNQKARMTIGTDSLTSNWQLSVWEEIKTIHRYASYVPVLDLITWATKNGALALGFEDTLGTIEPGKTPGLVALENIEESNNKILLEKSTSRRIRLF